jgi:ADP-ribosylglycohydrolase
MAVNLGDDTDTTGCVTGGLAGVHFGLAAIPEDWLQCLARKDDIGRLFAQFAKCTEEAVH